ncbi:hypothetical protein PRIPAC_95019, partial [Pristionchus pacificus]|uniref:Amino acid permease n=1 Tax=Pristionchus pacificus TaxID=54126 RepID=A0A2A6BBH9_PRIPA
MVSRLCMDRPSSTRSSDSSESNDFNKSHDTLDLPVKKKVFKRVIINDGNPRKDQPIILPPSPTERIQPKTSIDIPPDIDNYRKDTKGGGRMMQTRPSIYDLMEGGAIERKRSDSIYTKTLKMEFEKNQAAKKEVGVKFGWIEGVFIRCIQNIIGVILFIRISWVAAHCGILLGSLLICIASAVTLITAMSLSAICTNGEVKGGGLYYLISRTLGPEFGGSIGIMFAFGNACSAALYLVGMAETIVNMLKSNEIEIVDGDINDMRIIGLVLGLIVMGIILVGISFESMMQKVMLIPLAISFLGFFIGSFIPTSAHQRGLGMTGWSMPTISENLWPRFVKGETFFTVFAVYFPAATGIMAGANISGDLKNPQSAIPKGTVLAILASTAVYLVTLLVMGSTFVRNANGTDPSHAFSTLLCAADSSCKFGSYNFYQVMATISVWSPLVLIGIIAATSSSTLASMISAPKILQAVCNDKLFPYIDKLGKGYGKDKAPRRCYVITFGITLLGVVIGRYGDLNMIAPIISNFFLAAYALVNYSCFDASFAGNAGFRPGFKYYSMYLSLFGSIICIVIMFTMSWITALITFVVFLLIFGFLKYRKPNASDVNWGSSMHANHYKRTLRLMHTMHREDDHVKNYRPQILVLSSTRRRDLTMFAHSITRGSSLLMHATIQSEDPSSKSYASNREATEIESNWMRYEGIKGFPLTIASKEGMAKTALGLFQSVGIGKVTPNIVLLGYLIEWNNVEDERKMMEGINDYFATIQTKLIEDKKKKKLALPDAEEFKNGGTIDVWWLADDGGLTLLIPHLLTLPKSYLYGAHLRIFTVTSTESKGRDKEVEMAALLAKFRIDFHDLHIISDISTEPQSATTKEFDKLIAPFRRNQEGGWITEAMAHASAAKTKRNLRITELLREKSCDCDLIVLTLPVPRKGLVCSTLYLSWLEMLTRDLPPTLLIRGNQTDMESRKESIEDEISFGDSANSSAPKWSRSDSTESLNTFDKSGVDFALPTRIFERKRPTPPVVIEVDEEKDDTEESVEAPPDIDFYRKNTLNGRLKRSRPSISDLIDGQIQPSNNEESNDDGQSKVEAPKEQKKFGWIEGVFIRCLQNIIGVILFIRISWVTAHCGILLGSLLILLASSVTIVTTLSLSAICTNGEVKGGGLYYLISRTLGPEFGGSIGIMFAFGNAASGALYLVGMSETIVGILNATGIVIVDGGINDIRIVAVVMAFILKSIILAGISFESLLQKLMLFPMAVSILGFLAGSILPISPDQALKGATGWNLSTISSNIFPRFEHGQGFFSVFAVYFPAATGIMAGANISGDLKNPQTAIPKGTMLAIIASTLIYLTVLIVSGSIFVRDADGISPALSFPSIDAMSCAANATCPYGLYNYYQVMATISIMPSLIIIGMLSSTFSSALVSMVSAPKILQAVSTDKLFPRISGLAKEYGRDRAPRRAYALTFIITVLMAGIGDLNSIAPIISNFFLAAYTLVNYSCFDASFSGSPGFRPAFKYYSMYLSLFGALFCIVIMFTMNWVTALITTTVFMMIFGFLKYRKPDVNWGSSMHANNYKQTLQGMHRLAKADEHVKNYRPQILVLSSPSSPHLPIFAHSITRGASLIISATVDELAPSHRTHSHLRVWMDEERRRLRAAGVRAFPLAMSSEGGWSSGVKAMMQTVGLGRLVPNIVLIGLKTDWIQQNEKTPTQEKMKEINEYFAVIQAAFDRSLGVAILRYSQKAECTEIISKKSTSSKTKKLLNPLNKVQPVELEVDNIQKGVSTVSSLFPPIKGGTIDVWWLADDGGLTLLIPHLLTLPKSYLAGANLRVFSLTSDSSREKKQEAAMAALLSKFRISFKDLLIINDVSTQPSKETEAEFNSLIAPFRGNGEGMISDLLLKASTAKTRRNLRLAELLREKSSEAHLIVMTLPVPRKGLVCSTLYLSWLEMLTRGLPPTHLIRGNQTDRKRRRRREKDRWMDGWILDQSYREEERGGIETDKIESGERLLCFLPRGIISRRDDSPVSIESLERLPNFSISAPLNLYFLSLRPFIIME